jgi:hypothetical protein
MTRMNRKMADLLARTNIDLSGLDMFPMPTGNRDLVAVGDSVLFSEEFSRSGHVSLTSFENVTGYECFVNHVHMECREERPSLLGALGFVAALRKALEEFCDREVFSIIVSFSDDECTVRFHKQRQNEKWLADDIDGYKSESILEIWTRQRVGDSASQQVSESASQH